VKWLGPIAFWITSTVLIAMILANAFGVIDHPLLGLALPLAILGVVVYVMSRRE
jgi:hypothetical protein